MSKKNENQSHCVSNDFRENHEDVIHRQCQELDAWREKYRELYNRFTTVSGNYDAILSKCKELEQKACTLAEGARNDSVAIASLEAEKSALCQSNRLLQDELKRVKKDRDELAVLSNDRAVEIDRLRHRGFFARLLNK